MSWLITNTVAAILLPPLNFLALICIGLLVLRRRPRFGKALLVVGLASLWIFSMPVTGERLLWLLERDTHTDAAEMKGAQAIVVLAGGSYFNAPEYGGDTINHGTLERLRLGALLHHRTELPILVSGGNPDGGPIPDALMMQRVLQEEFRVPVAWVEPSSNNTLQNAYKSGEILSRQGIDRIILVTHGWHMPRARKSFERAGFHVFPAGTGYHNDTKLHLLKFVPGSEGLRLSGIAFHEVVGLIWYSLQWRQQTPAAT